MRLASLTLAALLAAAPVFAQTPPPPDALQAATGQTLSEVLGVMVQWRARAIAAEQQVAKLQAEAAKKAAAEPPKPEAAPK